MRRAMGGRVKAVLIDLSGTLHVGDDAVPGAVEALQRLRGAGLQVKFVTNTTKESRASLHTRLTNIGFTLHPQEIFTSLSAASDLLKKKRLKPYFLVEDEALEDFKGLTSFEGSPNCVVVGLAPQKFNRLHMNEAFRVLIEGGDLIAIHEARYYKVKDGLDLGPGLFVKALEYATGLRATVVGKPNPAFFKAALPDDVQPHEAVMIGDDVQGDIGGAQGVGLKGLLVKTGKYREGDEGTLSPPPHATLAHFGQAVDLILSNNL